MSGITVFGSINLDVMTRVAELPRPGETVLGSQIIHSLGGKGANQAVAAARMGVASKLVAAVGDDAAGTRVSAEIRAFGVDTSAVACLPGARTGVAQIFVADDGENMIIVVPGANSSLAHRNDAVTGTAVFLAQLEVPLDSVAAFLRYGAQSGARTVLNAAPAVPGAVTVLFPLVDYLIVNEIELVSYAPGPERPISVAHYAERARALLNRTDQTIIVTRGAAGVIAVTADEVIEIPARPAKVLDTTGAGDCFCGVFAALLADGIPLERALRLASVAASLSVERLGASDAMPDRAEVDRAAGAAGL